MPTLRRIGTTSVALAAFLLGDQYGLSPDGRRIELPGEVSGPTKASDCDKLAAIWSNLSDSLDARHQACLDAHQGQKGNPNAASGPGSLCSFDACQSLHSARYVVAERRKGPVDKCRADLKEYEARQKAFEDEQKRLQADLDRQNAALAKQQADAEALRQKTQQQQEQLIRAAMDTARAKAQAQLSKSSQLLADKPEQDVRKADQARIDGAGFQTEDLRNISSEELARMREENQNKGERELDTANRIDAPALVQGPDGTLSYQNPNSAPDPLMGYVGAAAEVVKAGVDAAISAVTLAQPEMKPVKQAYDTMQGILKAIGGDSSTADRATGTAGAAAAVLEAANQDKLSNGLSLVTDSADAVNKYGDGKTGDAKGSAVKAVGDGISLLAQPESFSGTVGDVVKTAGDLKSASAGIAEGVDHFNEVTATSNEVAERLALAAENQAAIAALLRGKAQSSFDLTQRIDAELSSRQSGATPSPVGAPPAAYTAYASPADAYPPLSPYTPLSYAATPVSSTTPQATAADRRAETDAVLRANADLFQPGVSTMTFGSPQSAGPSDAPKPPNVQYENYDHPTIPSSIDYTTPQPEVPLIKHDAGVDYGNPNQPNVPSSLTFGGGSQSTVLYQAPVAPAAPSSLSQCDDLQRQWATLLTRTIADHDACLNAYTGPGRPDSGGPTCSYTACQAQHNSMTRVPAMANAAVNACRTAVNGN